MQLIDITLKVVFYSWIKEIIMKVLKYLKEWTK